MNAEVAAVVVQLTAIILERSEKCQAECDSELSKVSNSTPQDVAGQLLDHANCGGTSKSDRWEPGKAPVLVSGAGHDALPMAEITKVTYPCCWDLASQPKLGSLCTSCGSRIFGAPG